MPSPPPPPYDPLDMPVLSNAEVFYMTAQHEKTRLARYYNSGEQHPSEPKAYPLPSKNDLGLLPQHIAARPESPQPQADAYSRATKWRDFTSALDSLNEFAETPGPSWFVANSTTDLATIHARISILLKFLREAFPGGDDETAALHSQVSQLAEVSGAQASEIERLEQEIHALRSCSVETASPLATPVKIDEVTLPSPLNTPDPIEANSEHSVLEPLSQKLDEFVEATSAHRIPDPLQIAIPSIRARQSSSSSNLSLSPSTGNTHRLILDVVREPTQRPSGSHVVKAVNDRLHALTDDSSIRISALSYSRRGRPVVTTCDNVSTDCLVPFADVIFTTMFGQALARKYTRTQTFLFIE